MICLPGKVSRLLLVAAVASLALAQLPGASRADEAAPPAGDGPKKLVKYIACASAIGFAPTIPTAIAAFMTCAQMFTEEMPVI